MGLGSIPWLHLFSFPKWHTCPDVKEIVPPSLVRSWDPFLGPQKWNIAEVEKLYPVKGSCNSGNNLVLFHWCRMCPQEEHTESEWDTGPCLHISAASPKVRVTDTQGCSHTLHYFLMKQTNWCRWRPGWFASGVHVPSCAVLLPPLCLSTFSVLITKIPEARQVTKNRDSFKSEF